MNELLESAMYKMKKNTLDVHSDYTLERKKKLVCLMTTKIHTSNERLRE